MPNITLSHVKKGDFVRRKKDSKKTYIKSEYDRASKTFALVDFDDVNRVIYAKRDTLVYIGFEF